MGLTIVCGGQFGSEGKGKVANYLANRNKAAIVVRVGGSNSGHAVYANGTKYILRMLPAACIGNDSMILYTPGSYVDFDILEKELELTGVMRERIVIDPRAWAVRPRNIQEEEQGVLGERISSTCTGIGSALVERIQRNSVWPIFSLPKDYRVACTNTIMRESLDRDEYILVEGTQGYGLSLLQTPYWPYCTARDVSAAGIVAECGMSPMDVEDIVMCVRTYPIRVAGNSGYLYNELTWDEVTKRAGSDVPILERTSVTDKIRRVGEFDMENYMRALNGNRPTKLVMNFADYLGNGLLPFVENIEKESGHKFDYLGFNPQTIEGRNELCACL